MSRGGPPELSVRPAAELLQFTEGPRILVVDDEEAVGTICQRALSNCRVERAADGRRALELLTEAPFDLVLTDVNMPDMDGLELLRTIKANEPNQAVIVMTGFTCHDTILEALKADADDFISKPFNLLQLQTLINKALEKKRLRQELLQLKRMDRLKSDFLGLISHKLNNPVTAISLFLQNLEQDAIDLDDPAFRAHFDLVRNESEELVTLIQSLLFYSELALDDTPPQVSSVDLLRLVREVLDEAGRSLERSGIRVSVDAPPEGVAGRLDRKRIRFVIRALLDNAISASQSGDSLHLRLVADDATATLVVTDPGVGIAESEQAKIFEKFYQVERPGMQRARGFGLGLYYARQFAREHGGSLTLRSAPGCGSAFTLTLPHREA